MKLPDSLNGLGSVLHRMKFGTSTTWNGMIRVAMRMPNRKFRPRNGITAKANAAREHANTSPIVLRPAILSELRKKVPNVTSPKAFHIRA